MPAAMNSGRGRRNENVTDVNEKIDPFELTPLQATAAFIEAVDELNMPHPAHIHCNNLGHSGNIQTTLDTMKAAEGHRAHIAHVQFHSYAGELGKRVQTGSEAIIDYINNNKNITTDIGMVMFGKATAMTADAPLTWMLRFKDTKWVNADTECESGCGVMPFEYQDTNYTHTMQWAIGLELFLLSQDPWRVMFSTDHPNGASFRTYPRLIRLLMDRGFRAEMMGASTRRRSRTACCRNWTGNTPCRKSPSSPARHPPGHWAWPTRGTWAWARMPTSRSTRMMKTAKGCSTHRAT